MNSYSFKTGFKSNLDENDCLNIFNDNIISLRKSLFVFSKKLPKSLGETLVRHYKNRLKRAVSSPMLGEFAIYLIGDLFRVPMSVINKLSFPWLLLYEYCLLIDDIIDSPAKDNHKKFLLSQLLLHSSTKEYKNIFNNDFPLWESFDIYYQQWFDAILFELNMSGKTKTKTNEITYLQQGRKSALVKFCASSLIALNNKRSLNYEEEKCLDDICCGVQLLDDLTDIKQDFSSGVSNTIITKTYKWIKDNGLDSKMDINNLSDNQLKVILVFSDAIYDSLYLTQIYLSKGINFSNNREGVTAKYFSHIINKCETNIEFINELKKSIPFNKVQILLMNDQLEKNKIYQIDIQKISNILESINLLSYTIPKACN